MLKSHRGGSQLKTVLFSGPLVAKVPNTSPYSLIGVVSWGAGCGRAFYPGVYARVTAVMPWIQSHIQGQDTCGGTPGTRFFGPA